MKTNFKIITLTAICMMTGISFLEAATQSSTTILNKAPYSISVEIKSRYKKSKNGSLVTRHDQKIITIAAGSNDSPIQGTINYDGGMEDIIVTHLSGSKWQLSKTTKTVSSKNNSGKTFTKNVKTITISDDAKTPGKPSIAISNTSEHDSFVA